MRLKKLQFIYQQSIRTQLISIILLTTLILVSSSMFASNYLSNKIFTKAAIDNANAISRALAQNFLKIILQDSTDIAADTTSALKAFPDIIDMYLYDSNGLAVFQYHKHQQTQVKAPPKIVRRAYTKINQEALVVFMPAIYDKMNFGYLYFSLSTEQLNQWINILQLITLVIMLILIPLSFMIARYSQQLFSNPLIELTSNMKKVESNHDYSIRIATTQKNEIGELYNGFNNMLETIESSNTALNDQKYALDQAAIVSISDLKGKILYVNEQLAKISAYTSEELIGQNHNIMNSGYHDEQFFKHLWETIEAGKIWRGEVKNKAKDNSFYWVDTTIIPFLNKEQKPYQYLAIRYEITDRKKAELELKQLNETLEQRVAERTLALEESNKMLMEAEKMAALGSLVAGVAHEINTPVGIGVTASSHLQKELQFLKEDIDNNKITKRILNEFIEDSSETAEIILKNLERTAVLVKSFKQVASDQSNDEIRHYDISEYLNEIILSLKPKLKKYKHKIEINCNKDIMVKNHPGAISQIITNFINNSLIYAFKKEEEGTISISVNLIDTTIKLTYHDNGKGIDKSSIKKIFEPFFTTNRTHGGTGLGLHIVYNLVTQSLKGNISCQSSLGKGTTFTLEFPQNIT